MKRSIELAAGLVSLAAAVAGSALAQNTEKYKAPAYNGCIRQFYDARMYNWLAFENTCSEAVSVVYIAFNPGYGGSAMELRPGRHDSTGWSRREVDHRQGFQLYVCPAGYIPVDANDRYVNRVNTKFRCRRQ